MKEKLYINKRLPYIKLPKEKIDLFIKWYNLDLRGLEDLPEVFEEGYLEVDTSEYISMKLPTIFEIKNEDKYNKLKELSNKTRETYSKMIIYFHIQGSVLKLLGYYGNNESAFSVDFKLKEDETMKKIMQYIASTSNKNFNHLPEVNEKLVLDLWKYNTFEDMNAEQKAFNRSLGDACFGLVVSVIWYLATNTSEKYLVSNTRTSESNQYADNHSKHKHNHNRTITSPIYYLADKKPMTVDKLIKKRNGWTISHSFQVRGHYRHYKNGKTIFIKSYEKGKELDNFQNSVITVNPDY